jgi:hypothetical protein
MNSLLSTTDLIIFFGSLIAVMGLGLWVGRKEDSSEDYFLAGRSTRWWGVAGSIFGSNVSANHIVGMMGVGFAVGFAQSHFEITAIAGLLMLCYFFLPVYRKLNVYTLSDYLSRRYDDRSRFSYALIMVIIMVVIQMVPGFYIGSRSINILLQGDTGRKAVAEAVAAPDGKLSEIKILHGGEAYGTAPKVLINNKEVDFLEASLLDGQVEKVVMNTSAPEAYQGLPLSISFSGGNLENPAISPGDVDPLNYQLGILIMALITGAYVIIGGLKAVIITDVIRTFASSRASGCLYHLFTTRNWRMGQLDGSRPGSGGCGTFSPLQCIQPPCPALDRCAQWTDGASFLLLGNQPVHCAKSSFGNHRQGGKDGDHRSGVL